LYHPDLPSLHEQVEIKFSNICACSLGFISPKMYKPINNDDNSKVKFIAVGRLYNGKGIYAGYSK